VCYNLYETRDGETMTLSALEPEFWLIFCQAIGRQHLQGQQLAPALPGEPVYDELCALFATRTQQEWAEVFAGLDACCDPVYSVEDALVSAPVQALDMLTEQGLRPPVRFSRQLAGTATTAPPLGTHTAPILAELGYDTAQLEALRAEGVV
jgi:crotonobetainyl-CoA:carnitine CoA-transferase CaiB-like acyl-CoA transferase